MNPLEKMKMPLMILAAALVMAPAGRAQESADTVPIAVHNTSNPLFPQSLIRRGVRHGTVSLTVAVDETGRLTDCLVTAYSFREFAESAMNAVKHWKFDPARVRGAPHAFVTEILLTFKIEGFVVTNINPSEWLEIQFTALAPNSEAFSACRMGQLDRIPRPTKFVMPDFHREHPRGADDITVWFYIDETGRVRVPRVSLAMLDANERLASIAMATVAKWEFEPPTSNRRPVLVRAQQDFAFLPVPSADQPRETSRR